MSLDELQAYSQLPTLRLAELAYQRACERYHQAFNADCDEFFAEARDHFLRARAILRRAQEWEAAGAVSWRTFARTRAHARVPAPFERRGA